MKAFLTFSTKNKNEVEASINNLIKLANEHHVSIKINFFLNTMIKINQKIKLKKMI